MKPAMLFVTLGAVAGIVAARYFDFGTPVSTIIRAAEIGYKAGVRYVYVGNRPGEVGKYENKLFALPAGKHWLSVLVSAS